VGDPKKPRKTFSRPRSPWRSDQLGQELYLLGMYGLRNKRELWKAQTNLSAIRKQARMLLAANELVRQREEGKLLNSLLRRGLVKEGVTLDDVLSLSVEDMLGRRLQTVVYKKGLAVSPLLARQHIVHGHVKVGERTITIPSYEVGRTEEDSVQVFMKQKPQAAPTAEAPKVAEAPPAQ
jgi:small subunit ribosomal protein S4